VTTTPPGSEAAATPPIAPEAKSGPPCLRLDRTGNRFVASNHDDGRQVVFGGPPIAQTIMAAAQCVPGKQVLSPQSTFARGASTQAPVELDVDVLHDGRTLATAAVGVAQGPRSCCSSIVMFHDPDDDLVRHGARPPAGSTRHRSRRSR
jgi:acyl-CoA thioesterase-2